VLLPCDRYGGHIVQATSCMDGLLQGGPPSFRVNFRAWGVWCRASTEKGAGFGIPNDDFARLRGAVHSGDQWHG
jgi:hypothetical protein